MGFQAPCQTVCGICTDKRVTPRLPWRNGSPLAFRVVHGVTGHLLSCVWNLWVFPDDAQGCQCPFVLCLHPQGCLQRGFRARTPLSSRVATRISWSLLSGLKGVQPPLQFGERTRDCSPGHAGIEGPQLSRTGRSAQAWCPCSGHLHLLPATSLQLRLFLNLLF